MENLYFKILIWSLVGMFSLVAVMKIYPDPKDCPIIPLSIGVVVFGPAVWIVVLLAGLITLFKGRMK